MKKLLLALILIFFSTPSFAALNDWAENGATRDYYNRAGHLPWKNFMGDWIDKNGVEQGSTPFATGSASGGVFEIDVTGLVNDWKNETFEHQGFYLKKLSGATYKFHSRQASDTTMRPVLELDTSSGIVILQAEADTHLLSGTYQAQGETTTLDGDRPILIRFPLEDYFDLSIQKATLRMVVSSGSNSSEIGVYRVFVTHYMDLQVNQGLAANYSGDDGITNHPDVLFSADFETGDALSIWTTAPINWNSTVDIVSSDPARLFAPLSGNAMRVIIPLGKNYGLSTAYKFMDELGYEPEEIYFRYYLRLGDTWEHNFLGGKLPGISGTYDIEGWGGSTPDKTKPEGWSSRGLFDHSVDPPNPLAGRTPIGFYTYHMDQPGTYGHNLRWINDYLGLVPNNEWRCIEQYAKMNTPGIKDGILRAWVNGKLAFEKTDLRFRGLPATDYDPTLIKIEKIWMNVYHGGSDSSDKDQHVYIDNVVIAKKYIGPANLSGSVSVDDTPPTIPQSLNAIAQSKSQIDLTWQAATDPESGILYYNIYRNDAVIDQSTMAAYSDTGLTEDTTYTYEILAVNGAGTQGTKSASVSATTLADTTSPSITSASANGTTNKVTVVFSEPVEQASSTTASNYQIDNGITVSNASLGTDLKTVTLTTSSHSDGVSYTLTVNNIKDRASAPNMIASSATKNYVFVAQLVISNLTVASGKAYEVVLNGLNNGAQVYIDRTYTYNTVPVLVEGATYIKTANDDKGSTGISFLSFDVNQDVTVYVNHDDRASNKPSWLASFTDTGEDIVTSDTTFSLFAKDFSSGTVVLGGNEANSMYTVIITGQGTGSTPDTTQPSPPTGLRFAKVGNVDTIPPTVPTSLQGTAISSSHINLSWTASTDNVGVTGYKVYRDGIEITTINQLSFTDTGLSPSTAYSYTISAYDGAGNASSQSTIATVTTKATDTIPPTIPTNLQGTAISSSQITLSWSTATDSVGVSGYKVFRDGIGIASNNQTSYTDTGLTAETTYFYTISAYDAAGNESNQSTITSVTTKATDENYTLTSLPDNTWLKLNPGASKRYICRGFEVGNVLEEQPNPMGRSYSGIHYGDGKIFYFGGGHKSHPGNDMEIYDIANNIWTQPLKPEVCGVDDASCNGIYGGSGTSSITPSGRPYTEHTYQMLAYDKTKKMLMGVLWSGTWTYDPATKAWTTLAGPHAGNTLSPLGNTGRTHLMSFDEDLNAFQAVITSGGGTGGGVYIFQNGGWTKRNSNLPSTSWVTLFSTYIPDQHIHIVRGWGKWWKYDAVADTWAEITGIPAGAQAITDFDYDTTNKVFVGVRNVKGLPFTVWTYDVITDTWTQMSNISSTPGVTPYGSTVINPLFKYDPLNNVFIFLHVTVGSGGTGGSTETWAYRYK